MKYISIFILTLFTSLAFCQDTTRYISPSKDTLLTITSKVVTSKSISVSYSDTDKVVKTIFKPYIKDTSIIIPPTPPQPKINIALNRNVIVSSVQTADFSSAFAVDGNTGTRWSTLFSDPQFISVDLGSNYSIARVHIIWEFAKAKDYTIQTSLDGTTWTTIKTIAGNTATDNDHVEISSIGRYVRIFCTARTSLFGYSIYELEVYGRPDGTIPPVNQIPGVIAGSDQSISLPSNSVTLNGKASDQDGTIISYLWTKVSGGAAVISKTSEISTGVTGLVQGVYVFKLEVIDNSGANNSSNVTVTVNAQPPVGTINYLSLPNGVPQVYSNVSNIIIENMKFTNTSGHLLQFNNCSNITVRNCYFGKSGDLGIYIQGGNNITVDKNLFANNRTMIIVQQSTGNIKITNNQFVNAKGPFPRGQYIQLINVTGPGNLIKGNRGECFTGESLTEDLISQFASRGTAESPVTIEDNIFRGGGSPTETGGGIIGGDQNGQFQLVQNNKVVNVGHYGISCAGGQGITIRNNMAYADAINNAQKASVGYSIANWGGGGCTGITFTGNRSNWTSSVAGKNDYWTNGSCSGSLISPTTITLQEMAVPSHLIDFVTPTELLTIRANK